MDFKGLRVLVLDGYGRQTATIVQQLHDLKCVTTTLNCSKLDIGYASHYPAKKLLHPEVRHDQEALKKVLDAEIMSGNYDVVFPLLEPSTEVITKNAEIYSQYVKIIAAPYDAFVMAYDKQKTMMACQEAGVPCPITRADDEDLEAFAARTTFPLAVKPRKGTGSMGFCKIENKEELFLFFEKNKIDPNDYIVQEYIPNSDIHYSAYVMMGGENRVCSSLMCIKARWYPVDSGPGCFACTTDRADIKEYSEKLLQSMNWKSFAHVCFMLDPRDNVPKVIEINGRIPAGIKILKCAGIPIVAQLLELAMTGNLEPFEGEVKKDVRLRYSQTDLLWFLKSPNRFKSKPSWFSPRHTRDYIFSLRDPIPYFAYSINHIKSYRSDMKKRSHKI